MKKITALLSIALLASGCVVYKDPSPVGAQNNFQKQQKKQITEAELEYCEFLGEMTKISRDARRSNLTRAETEYQVLKLSAKYQISDVRYQAAQLAISYAYNPEYDVLSDLRLLNYVQTACLENAVEF